MIEAIPRLGVIRVLLIEDHVDLAFVLQKGIERAGFDVTWVATCHDAMALIQQRMFNILVSAIELPDGTGWDIVRFWKSHCGYPAIAISTLLSHPASVDDNNEFDAWLLKPFSLWTLITAIYERVGGSDLIKAKESTTID